MNQTERAYANVLEANKLVGLIAHYEFEKIKLKLADNTFYTPDFWVVLSDGRIEFHEVKAMTAKGVVLAEDDAKVKIKVAAEQFWQFDFVIAARGPKSQGYPWKIERVGNG
jgi:hypothetical protein